LREQSNRYSSHPRTQQRSIKAETKLRKLHKIADDLGRCGYTKASSFIMRNANFMVTFAELAVEDVDIPYTTNQIERLIGGDLHLSA